MLVVTRKEGETIVVGDDIEITVVQIKKGSNRVRIGINAPEDTQIFRGELLEEKDENEG